MSNAFQDIEAAIERIVSLMAERKGLNDDINELVAQAASLGYSKQAVRKVATIRFTGLDKHKRLEEEIDCLLHALGYLNLE